MRLIAWPTPRVSWEVGTSDSPSSASRESRGVWDRSGQLAPPKSELKMIPSRNKNFGSLQNFAFSLFGPETAAPPPGRFRCAMGAAEGARLFHVQKIKHFRRFGLTRRPLRAKIFWEFLSTIPLLIALTRPPLTQSILKPQVSPTQLARVRYDQKLRFARRAFSWICYS